MNTSAPIVLVGGAPGAGKTTLARALSARLGEPTQSFDLVLAGIRAVTTIETHPAFHAGRTGHLQYFTERLPDQLIEDALDLEAASWPALQRICSLALSGPSGLVMDWWLLSPERLASMGIPGLKAIWIAIDPGALADRERSNSEFFAGSVDPDRMFQHFMARSRWANERYPSQAQAFGFPVINQPGDRPTDDLVDEAIVHLGAR